MANLLKSGDEKLERALADVGRCPFYRPQIAEQFLEGSIVDFVSMGRSWLADEEWGRKVLEGRDIQKNP